MMHAESRLQANCVRWFRATHAELAPLLFSVPNGAKVRQSQARVLAAEGMVAGVADLLLLLPSSHYHGLCIEMKREGEQEIKDGRLVTTSRGRGYQSQEQRRWQAAVEAKGYCYVVARSLDEFIQTINNYTNDYIFYGNAWRSDRGSNL